MLESTPIFTGLIQTGFNRFRIDFFVGIYPEFQGINTYLHLRGATPTTPVGIYPEFQGIDTTVWLLAMVAGMRWNLPRFSGD